MGIFSELSKIEEYDGTTGKKELRDVYIDSDLPIREQIEKAEILVRDIQNYYEAENKNVKFHMGDMELIQFSSAFMAKLNAAAKSGIFKEKWLEEFTENLIFESDDIKNVKLGLIMSEKYLHMTKLKQALKVFSHSGEYLFYMMKSIKRINGYNSYLMRLAKHTEGTIRVFAISNIEYFNDNITKYFLERGYKDETYEVLLINYILVTVDVYKYLDSILENREKLNKMSYLIYKHLRSYDFKKSPIREFIISKFVPLISERGSSLYSLLSILLVGQSLVEEELADKSEYDTKKIIEPLRNDFWRNIFLKSIKSKDVNSVDLIEMANFYDYKLTIDELRAISNKNNMDFYIYWYINNRADDEIRIEFLKDFYKVVDIDKLIVSDDDEFKSGNSTGSIENIIFTMTIKGCAKIFPEGKDLALKGIMGRGLEVRKEAVNALRYHKNKLTKDEIDIINKAFMRERNFELKNAISKLLYSKEQIRDDFIDETLVKHRFVPRHVKDIYLMSTYVAGFEYRDVKRVEEELEDNRIFLMFEEPENPYDDHAIRIAGPSGYVIGYIPRKDNTIISNLLAKNMYLYCLVREYSLEEGHISIDIYFSYKNILDEAGQLFRVLTSKDNGYYQN